MRRPHEVWDRVSEGCEGRSSWLKPAAWVAVAALCFAAAVGPAQARPAVRTGLRTGLRPVSAAELRWLRHSWPRILEVRPNRLGVQRSSAPLDLPVLDGQETVSAICEDAAAPALAAPSPGLGAAAAAVPPRVDNSALPSFPPIRSQGSLASCVSFAATYYQLTNAVGLSRGWNAKAGAAESHQFSPKWTNTMANGGANADTTFLAIYDLLGKHGAALWSQFPYDSDFRAWCLDPAVWRSALGYRTNPVQYVGSVSSTGLSLVKQLLGSGYVLVFGTWIQSWQFKVIGNDPSTPDDDRWVGYGAAYMVKGALGAHAMTIVGYDDAIWVDVNGNARVDAGERGALRVANSSGAGWGDRGFTWLAYDALKARSAVAGGPTVGRVGALFDDQVYHLTVPAAVEPRLLARFTVVQAQRSQLRVFLGVGAKGASAPGLTWSPAALNRQGGAYAFDGGTAACPGTFVLDFSDLAPLDSTTKRFFLGVTDAVRGSPTTLAGFTLIDAVNGDAEVPCSALPAPLDGQTGYAGVDYAFYDRNLPPSASIAAVPLRGLAPLRVTFDGSGSLDRDGAVLSFAWAFGDGAVDSGPLVSHTYAAAGVFLATLTVRDDRGATSSQVVDVTVLPDPPWTLSVSRLVLTVTSAGAGAYATARISVVAAAGVPLRDVTVMGFWSGRASGYALQTTDASGVASVRSARATTRGPLTFTVMALTAPGYCYDSAQNLITSATATW